MRPKKRQRETVEGHKPEFEQIQADHELFLQAFEKPTQIYRYLRTRNILSPIFLHRNLSYMQERSTRNNWKRRSFNVDSILDEVVAKHKKETQVDSYKTEYMNLTFTAFQEKGFTSDSETVEVEAFLLKICHKKRKDVSSPVMQISLGQVPVPYNPEKRPSQPAVVAPALSVASENFNHNNGHAVKSYMLLLRVSCAGRRRPENGICNGDLSESEEPCHKKRKNGKLPASEDDMSLYGAELVIYDKHKRCLLTDGDYELALQDFSSKVTAKKPATWETVMDGKAVGPFEVFNRCPTLKFKLLWNVVPLNGVLPAAAPPINNHAEFLNNNHYNNINNHVLDKKETVKKEPIVEKKKIKESDVPVKTRRIFYQFLYNNNTRQQTEARDDLHCPWCSLNCMKLYSLLKHLRNCHARFNFSYSEHPKGARIDVSINEGYDGSYVGNPQDLHSHIGYAFSRNGPVRRTPVTFMITYRPPKPSWELQEFLEPDDGDNDGNKQFIQGHNRLYYHTVTSQPLRPQEIDLDSEEENDPDWLRQKTINLIEEFTDVNEGEKEVMKMWNLHIMHHNYIGDCQLPHACRTFVEEHGSVLIEKSLCRNLLLHMINLYDFSLIKPEVVYRTMMQLYRLRDGMGL